MPPAGLAGRVRDRGRVPAKRRIPIDLPVPCDVLRRYRRTTSTRDARGPPDATFCVARLATRQCGVVEPGATASRSGSPRRRSTTACKRGRLIRIHQGVYAVGHEAISDRGRMIAALLAAGPGAALSHRTAAYLWSLIPSMPQFVEVTLTTEGRAAAGASSIHDSAAARHHAPPRPAASPPRSRRSRSSAARSRPRPRRGARPRPDPALRRRPRRADPQRARGQLLPASTRRAPAPAGQPRVGPHRRLPLAGPPRHRGDRRLAAHATAPRSRTTARATRRSRPPATPWSASPGARCTTRRSR